MVEKNADFTEGQGPMVAHKLFAEFIDAHNYVMQQEGIFGSRQGQSVNFGVNVLGRAYVLIRYNGYNIVPMTLE